MSMNKFSLYHIFAYAILNYISLNKNSHFGGHAIVIFGYDDEKDSGTGGGIFRKMYGEFLLEANNFLFLKAIEDIGKQYLQLSEQWDALADSLWNLGETGHIKLLKPMSFQIENLYQTEKSFVRTTILLY